MNKQLETFHKITEVKQLPLKISRGTSSKINPKQNKVMYEGTLVAKRRKGPNNQTPTKLLRKKRISQICETKFRKLRTGIRNY